MITIDKLETIKEANQIGTLQRASDTRYGSYFHLVCSLIKIIKAIFSVINDIINE